MPFNLEILKRNPVTRVKRSPNKKLSIYSSKKDIGDEALTLLESIVQNNKPGLKGEMKESIPQIMTEEYSPKKW